MNHLLANWTIQGLHHVFRSKVPEKPAAVSQRMSAKPAHALEKPAHLKEAAPKAAIRQSSLPQIPATSFEWEKPWSVWQKKITRGARFVFTYEQLSEDFGGQANQARSAFWRALLGELQWPKGTVSFWPCLGYPDNVLEPGYFWRGVQLIKPRYLVFFGSRLREKLLPASDQFFSNGWPGLSLEMAEPDVLVADQQAGLAQTLKTLSSILP